MFLSVHRHIRIIGVMALLMLFLSSCQIIPPSIATATPSKATTPEIDAELIGTPAPPDPNLNPEQCQRIVDDIMSMTRSLETPDHFQEGVQARQDGDFDPNRYFETLTHLSMEPGYILDYVYFRELIGGEPILYARKVDEPPFDSFSEYIDAVNGDYYHWKRSLYLEHVQTDGTPQGFLEYVILSVMGEQFYLYWHANYNDRQVVCTQEGVEKIIAALEKNDFGVPLTERQKQLARRVSVFPSSKVKSNVIEIQVMTFTKWGGFEEMVFTMRRAFPHKILDTKKRSRVHYDCKVNF